MATVLSRKPGGSGGGGAPSGPAGGVLAGTYPNPTLAAGTVLFDGYALIRDEKAANTAGGASVSGDWQTSVLNTESFDTTGVVSVAANQVTISEAGTWYLSGRKPFRRVGSFKLKWRNITAGSDAVIGATGFTDTDTTTPDQVDGAVWGRFTIAGATVFELQYQCGTSTAVNGLGVPSNFGVVEVYGEVLLQREA